MASCDQLKETAYTSFNKVKQIIEGVQELDILYGPDYERCKESFSDQTGLTKTRYFSHGNYEVEYDNDGIRKLHYIYPGDGVVALYEERKSTAAMYYIHKDHLGSWQVITDQQGDVVQEQSFDAWGRRRNPTDWTYDNVNSDPRFHRGYTGHEHLDQLGLINMNGRMYDPVVARFLSPDIFVQDPLFSQSYNRYSYCMNNPLKYTDPSGWDAMPNSGNYPDLLQYYNELGSYFQDFPGSALGGYYGSGGGSSLGYMYQAFPEVKPFETNEYTFSELMSQQIVQAIVDGFNFYIVSYEKNDYLISSIGEYGTMIVPDQGGVIFSNPTTSAFLMGAVVQSGVNLGQGGGTSLPESDFVKYFLAATSVWSGTVQTGFETAKSMQPKVSAFVNGAKVLGRTTNFLGVISIVNDFATGNANTSTLLNGAVMVGGAIVLGAASVAVAPWVAGAGVVYGISSIFFEEPLNNALDMSKTLNFVKPRK